MITSDFDFLSRTIASSNSSSDGYPIVGGIRVNMVELVLGCHSPPTPGAHTLKVNYWLRHW